MPEISASGQDRQIDSMIYITFMALRRLPPLLKVMYIIESICRSCPDADISGMDLGRAL